MNVAEGVWHEAGDLTAVGLPPARGFIRWHGQHPGRHWWKDKKNGLFETYVVDGILYKRDTFGSRWHEGRI
ncbi:hypothetical protein LCGC14_1022180 [marine sediment metagenome]|uniref:Uncharacterized protein n=1 Tax=marine sediment metagenome TaxID=412755 RepID=A0A0F9QF91_9ZZZZ